MKVITVRKKWKKEILSSRERAESLIPTLAETNKIFLTDDNSLSFCFYCIPLPGADSTTSTKLNTVLNQSYPDETLISFSLYRSPDISEKLDAMIGIRANCKDKFYMKFIRDRANFLDNATSNSILRNEYTDAGVIKHDLGFIHDMKLIITAKIPIKSNIPTEKEIAAAEELHSKFKSNLDGVNFCPIEVDAKKYIRIMQTLVNHGKDSSWRFAKSEVEEDKPINQQIFDYNTSIDVEKNHLKIGDSFVRTLSAKNLPKQGYFGSAMKFIGEHASSQATPVIKNNFLITANIFYPNSEKTKSSINKKRTYAVTQAYGPLIKHVPVLGEKVQSFNEITADMQNNRLVKISLHVAVFAPTLDELNSTTESIKQQFSQRGIEIKMLEDSMVMLPVFLNCLPLCSDRTVVQDLFRYKTLTTKHCLPLLPVMGEWKGTGTPYLNLVTRNGQLLSFSVHDTGSNQNFSITAQSGSGKSFLTNEIIESYRSEGAKVWVIDVGRSYENLCEAHEGQFIHFGERADGSHVCINPFPLIKDWKDESDALISLVANMASKRGLLDDYQLSKLTQIMTEQWEKHGLKMTVDSIAKECISYEKKSDDSIADIRISDIGHQLFNFTSKGSYGKFFHGENNVQFNNDFVVLELEELKTKEHLQQIVLLQLIYQIQQAVYLGEPGTKKFTLIDEAWDLLNKDSIKPFIESAYRRFRKYGGSMGVVTQSISDLYSSATGIAIVDNSATSIILSQKGETITSIKEEKRIDLSDSGFELLRTVKTRKGAYSEIFVKSEFAQGIGRLIVSPFQVLLYSTATDDRAAIKRYRDQGLPLQDAINAVLDERGQLNKAA